MPALREKEAGFDPFYPMAKVTAVITVLPDSPRIPLQSKTSE